MIYPTIYSNLEKVINQAGKEISERLDIPSVFETTSRKTPLPTVRHLICARLKEPPHSFPVSYIAKIINQNHASVITNVGNVKERIYKKETYVRAAYNNVVCPVIDSLVAEYFQDS